VQVLDHIKPKQVVVTQQQKAAAKNGRRHMRLFSL
jgi:hypothetical protein